MKIKELKEILEKYNDNADVIIEYICSDNDDYDYYSYRGSDIKEDTTTKSNNLTLIIND